MQQQTSQTGYVILISVLVISVVGIAIAVSVITLGIGSTQTSLSMQESVQARALADGCAEYALDQLRQDQNYAGNESLSLGNGVCDIFTVLGNGNTDRTIQTKGTVDTTVRKVEVFVTRISPELEVGSWQEVAEY